VPLGGFAVPFFGVQQEQQLCHGCYLQPLPAQAAADCCFMDTWPPLCREHAQAVASQVGMLTINQLAAAERRKQWDKEVAQLRSTCQVSSWTPASSLSTYACWV
jgi:hypothetical protein